MRYINFVKSFVYKKFKLMPKISLDELEHMEDEVSFEKVHSKKGKIAKQSKYPEKKKHREKKINYWECLEDEDDI